jgi:putative nucleotidyltransferase with HDIG domain
LSGSNLILVVDDDKSLREVIRISLEMAGYTVHEEGDLAGAKRAVKTLSPGLVLMDMSLPGEDGDVITKELLSLNPDLKIVAYTGRNSPESVMSMLGAGAVGYLIKGGDIMQLPVRVRECLGGTIVIDERIQQTLWQAAVETLRYERHAKLKAQRLAEELEETYREIVLSLVEALRTRDHETQGHVDRVVQVTVQLAQEMGLNEEAVEAARYGALFHDIGKLGVPDKILFGEDELTQEGWDIIQQHTIVGERILQPIHSLQRVAKIVRSTHENWDGSGYPDGLAGDSIPLESRIIRVADSYDAMSSRRRYQEQQGLDQALETIRGLSGVSFDPDVVSALLALAKKDMLHEPVG